MINSDRHHSTDKTQLYRLSVLITIVMISGFILILRLGYLQLSQYIRYSTLSIKNRVSILPVAPPRGIIYDRNGIALAINKPVYALEIIPEQVKHLQPILNQLQSLIPNIDSEDIENFLKNYKHKRRHQPTTLKFKLSDEEVAIFSSNQHLFPGVQLKAQLMRFYPFGEITAHFLGYVGRINLDELKQLPAQEYQSTEIIGKTGIEKFYESNLHGAIGYEQIESDVHGKTLRTLNKKNAISGANLTLSIDIHLQEKAYEAFEDKKGAAIVIDVNNGEILSLVSAPSYDPNLFVSGISHNNYQALITNPKNPLYNRAVQGLYPPASTVKPYIALAGLDNHTITTKASIHDPGFFRVPGNSHKYRDWKAHGTVDLNKAITVSCDTYFYELAYKLGISAINDMLMKFGFGQLTHVDLPHELAGIVPSPNWKKRVKHHNWYTGDTIITAIGQGFMLSTPLQMVNAVATLATKGHRWRLHLLKKAEVKGKNHYYKPLEEYPIELSQSNLWQAMAHAMSKVITDRHGTGFRFGKTKKYDIAAKTGTAQVHSLNHSNKRKYDDIPELLRDHSLFVAYAPIDNPKIAIAVIVENDFIASNIARKIVDAYFDKIEENNL